MLRSFILFFVSVGVASAQESASQPSTPPHPASQPTSAHASFVAQCQGCFALEPLSLSPRLSLDVSTEVEGGPTSEEDDNKLPTRLREASKTLAWTSGVGLGVSGLLSLGSDDDGFGITLASVGMASAAGLQTAIALRAGARYLEEGRSRKLLRRSALGFLGAAALEAIAVSAASEANLGSSSTEDGEYNLSGTKIFVMTSLIIGTASSLTLSTGMALKGIQDRTAEALAQREPLSMRSMQEGELMGREVGKPTAFLAKASLGLMAASAAMLPMQSPLRDNNINPASVMFVTTSGAGLTASTSALYAYGLYRHQKTKRQLPLYAAAGAMALQSGLRAGLSTAFLFLADTRDIEYGPSRNLVSAAAFGYGATFSGVAALAMLGKARLEGTRAIAQEKRALSHSQD